MTSHDPSVIDLIKRAIRDAQDLLRSEIALAKTEAREEVRRVRAGATLLAGAALAGVIGLVFLLTTVALGLSEGLGWPVWSGFGTVTALTLVAAGTMAYLGRARLNRERHMPHTVDTVKENMRWIRARTS